MSVLRRFWKRHPVGDALLITNLAAERVEPSAVGDVNLRSPFAKINLRYVLRILLALVGFAISDG